MKLTYLQDTKGRTWRADRASFWGDNWVTLEGYISVLSESGDVWYKYYIPGPESRIPESISFPYANVVWMSP